MRSFAWSSVFLLGFAGCGGGGGTSLAGTCTPTSVPAQAPIPSSSSTAVEIYWDVSRSMRSGLERTRSIVGSLDAQVLQAADATTITHWAVGSTIRPAASGLSALEARDDFSLLNGAAAQAGEALAGRAGAVIFVSDMDLELPPTSTEGLAERCPDIPRPTPPTREQLRSGQGTKAGALFQRYLACGLGQVTPRELYAATFISDGAPRVHVLVLASNPALGRKIGAEMRRAFPTLAGVTLLDTADNGIQGLRCSWGAGRWDQPEEGAAPGIGPAEVLLDGTVAADACGLSCQRNDLMIPLQCQLGLAPASDAWSAPDPMVSFGSRAAMRAADGTGAEGAGIAAPAGVNRVALTSGGVPGTFLLQLGCGSYVTDGSPGRVTVAVDARRGWAPRQEPVPTAINADPPNVVELYRGLGELLQRLQPVRNATFQVELADD